MAKERQMRRSDEGAHPFAQIRVHVHSDELRPRADTDSAATDEDDFGVVVRRIPASGRCVTRSLAPRALLHGRERRGSKRTLAGAVGRPQRTGRPKLQALASAGPSDGAACRHFADDLSSAFVFGRSRIASLHPDGWRHNAARRLILGCPRAKAVYCATHEEFAPHPQECGTPRGRASC
jgi:hypothetical protein